MLQQLPCGCGLLGKLACECQKKGVKQVTVRRVQGLQTISFFSSKPPTDLDTFKEVWATSREWSKKTKWLVAP